MLTFPEEIVLLALDDKTGKFVDLPPLAMDQALAGAAERAVAQEAHLRLAQMYEALNQSEAAAVHYRQCALSTQQDNARGLSR